MKKQKAEALWILKNLKARTDFLRALGKELLKYNLPYFKGEKPLVTLKVRACAEALSVNPSTLYRAIKSKWIGTPQGIIPLKRLFCSKQSVEERLKELIDQETRPLTDLEILSILKHEGFDISRRSVAKHRQSLNIPSSRKRK